MRPTVRVLVAEDNDLLAKMVTTVLSRDGRFEVVGHAREGREAIEKTLELEPDVVLMDIHMPSMDGIEAAQKILAQRPAQRVLVLTGSELPGDEAAARLAGAAGFVRKEAGCAELADAVAEAAGVGAGAVAATRS